MPVDHDLFGKILKMMPKTRPQTLPFDLGELMPGAGHGDVKSVHLWLVWGPKVKADLYEQDGMDFVEGGNDVELLARGMHQYIPAGQCWIDASNDPMEWPFNAYHESCERRDLARCRARGEKLTPELYDKFHDEANEEEHELRVTYMRNPLAKKLGGY